MADTTFTRMQDATREDYKVIGRHSLEFFAGLPDRILRHLELLDSDTGGYAVVAAHPQSADRDARGARRARRGVRGVRAAARHRRHARERQPLRARRDDPPALRLRGEPLDREAPRRVPGLLLLPPLRARPQRARGRIRGHPLFGECAAFCARYDQNSFDPGYDTLPLAHFEPMVRKVFAAPKQSIYVNPETGRMGA